MGITQNLVRARRSFWLGSLEFLFTNQ